MIGKKINQLATELAPASTDLTIIGNPTTGVSKKITLAQLGAIFSGAVSFYTNYAAFPTPGTTDVIFCAKDTQKLYLWSGSAYVEVFPSQALLDTYQLRSEKGVSNGYASLDSSGKVPISQLPSSIMEYKGTWSAATNTPTLANGTGDTGDVYLCNAAGTVNFGAGPLTFAVGDYVVYSGTIWQRSSGAVGTVTSVAASITGNAIGITGSPVTTSGTLALAFAGTSAQYVNGAGNLITFPSIISQAQNLVTEVYNETGATLTKGTIVYINGGHGNLPTVTKALATGDSTSAQTYGIVQADITNNNNGYVVAAGRLENIDTQAYTEGTQLYLSSTTAGTWTSTKQYAPAHLVYVGIIVRSHPTQGIIEVKIQNGYELDEIHNVAAQTPSNNDGLFYESATSLWKNKSIATILGYTPQAQLNGTGFVKASGTTISYDNSTYVTTDTFQTISASKTFGVGFSLASAGGANQLTSFINTNSIHSGSAGTNVFGFNNSNNIYFGKGLSNGGVITYNNSAVRFYALPDADGTIALVGGSGVGTVTSVGLSSATSGVTIGSTPITTSGTITLAIATASGSQQGLLSSTDWTTFNNKQSALTNPVTGTGTTNYLPKFTGTSTIGNSAVTDDGTTVTLVSRALSGTSASFISTAKVLEVKQSTAGSATYYVFDNTVEATGKKWRFGYTGAVADAGTFSLYNETDSVLNFVAKGGNLGLGVTPSAWGTAGDVPTAFQFGASGMLYSYKNTSSSGSHSIFGANAYFDGSGFKYINTNLATYYRQYEGTHAWLTAPSGTAGNAISFTQAMTLNASGNLSLGNTNDTYKLDVSGTGRFTGALTGTSATFSGDVIRTSSNVGNINEIAVVNTATSGASSSRVRIQTAFTGGTTLGDAITQYTDNNNFNWSTGSGATTSRDFVITNYFTLGTSVVLRLAASTGAATFSSSVTAQQSKFWDGTQGLYIGAFTGGSGFGALYPSTVTPSNSNHAFAASSVATVLNTGSSGVIDLEINTTSALYINNSRNVGIGTTSPGRKLEVYAVDPAFALKSSTTTGYSELYFADSASDAVGFISYAHSTDNMLFGTSGSERMRITSGGNLLVGTSSQGYIGNELITLSKDSGTTKWSVGPYTGQASQFYVAAGSGVGVYLPNTSATSWSSNSDERLKTELKPIINASEKVASLRAVTGRYKTDAEGYSRAFLIAQDVQAVLPEAVALTKLAGSKDETEYLSLSYTDVIPLLVGAIKELKTELDTLKNK